MSLVLDGTNGLSDVDGSAATPAIRGTDTNTGIFFPAADTIAFAEGGVESARLDSSGNLGLGVTPSAWSGYGVPVIEAPAGGTFVSAGNGNIIGSNWFYAASNFTYKTTNFASYYYQVNGQHRWYTAPSGTAGNAISFTQAMTLDASGRLLLTDTSAPVGDAIFSAASSSTSDGIWTARVITRNTGNNTSVFMGNYRTNSTNTVASVAAHNAALTAWAPLYVNTIDGTAGNSGNVIMGGNLSIKRTTNPDGNALNVQQTTANSAVGIYVSSSSTGAINFYNGSGTYVNTITVSGSTITYPTSSDYRLKEDIQPMTGALAKVSALKPCTYKWRADGSFGQGFIAHELQEVIPQAVVGEKDAVRDDGSIKPQGIDTSFLVATLTAAIQEQQALITSQSELIDAQQAALQTLTAQVAALDARLISLEGTQP